jgi:hypothetical protein
MQTLYCCNGVIRVLESGVIYGSSNPTGHSFVPCAKRIEKYAKKELRSDNNFVNLYSEVEWVREAIKEGEAFFMSVVGNCSLVLGCSTFKVSSRIAPYFKNAEGKFERLWLTERFEPKMSPEHLNVHILASKLNKVIGCFKLELGELRYKNSNKAIAWELTSDKGTYYIPWHNGCIIKKAEESNLSFEKKSLKEMVHTYCALRFEEVGPGSYRVLVC